MGRQLTHLQQDAEALTQPPCNELSSWEVLVSMCPPPPTADSPEGRCGFATAAHQQTAQAGDRDSPVLFPS